MHDNSLSLAVLIVCHNRCEVTLSCLRRLYKLNLPKAVKMSVFLLDDGSKDGTSQAVQLKFSKVHLIKGNGQLYWNGGMRLAMKAAMDENADFFLWLNDDTLLDIGALASLFAAYQKLETAGSSEAILVGSTKDKVTQDLTYGGLRRNSRWQPLRFKRVSPGRYLKKCDTFNGNIVFFPKCVVDQIGNLDSGFTHGIGDYDYGLRAKKVGIQAWIVPGYLGTCSRNLQSEGWTAQNLTLKERWSQFMSVKGVPIAERKRYMRRHCGIIWPFLWLGPYLKFPFRHFMYRFGLK